MTTQRQAEELLRWLDALHAAGFAPVHTRPPRPPRAGRTTREEAVLRVVVAWIRASGRRERYREISAAARSAGMTNEQFRAAHGWSLRAVRRAA